MRREAMAMRSQGVPCAQIAKAPDRSVQMVQGWVAKTRQRGVCC